MAKANKKATKVKAMDMQEGFDGLFKILDELEETSEEILPLFAASIGMSKKILRMYQKAFEAGKKYVKPR